MEYKKITELAYTYIGLVTTMTKHYVDRGVPLLFNSSIKEEGIDISKPVFLDYDFAEKNKSRMHKKDDIITVHTGNIGTSAIIPDYLDGSLGFATIVTRIYDTNVLLPKFLCYYLNYGNGKEKLYKYARDARNNLNLTDYNKLMIPFLNINDQKEIVKKIDIIKSIINLDKKTIVLLEEIIKAKFNEMFKSTNTRLVDEVIASFKIGPFGSALHKNEISDKGFAFVLGTDNAVKNRFEYNEIRYICEEKYNQLINYRVFPGDIIMSMMGTVGKTSIVPNDIEHAIISSHLCILRTNNEIMLPEFFQCAFHLDDDIESQIDGIHNGSIMKGFNLKIVKNFKVKCPSIYYQKKFVKFKLSIDKIRKDVESHIVNMEELLQKVFMKFCK